MSQKETAALMDGKDEAARLAIAARVGEHLCALELGDADRRAAETVAKLLAQDAVERVRAALSMAVRHARHLPRDLALKIAHDVESVACPFLEVTEVFSESDWQRIVLTISRSSMAAVARRKSLSEPLAVTLAELGDYKVADALVENRATPMTQLLCGTLIDRFGAETPLMDKMAHRDDLLVEVVSKLTLKVSAAAREKLLRSYRMTDYIEVVAAEAEAGSLLEVIKTTPLPGMPALARAFRREGKLTDYLLLNAARGEHIDFVAAALSDRMGSRIEQVRGVLLHAESRTVGELLRQANIPPVLHEEFWAALAFTRAKDGKSS